MSDTIDNVRATENTIMKTSKLAGALLLAALGLVLAAAVSAEAAGPWQWQLTMKADDSGKDMIMPSAMFLDVARERYYITDPGNNRLLSFDKDGVFLNAFNAMEQLITPYDMLREDGGRIWVVEKGRNSLTLIDLQAKLVTPHSLSDDGKLIYPDRLERLGESMLVLDKASGALLVLDQELRVSRRIGCADCVQGLVDFKVQDDGIWALDQRGKAVYHFSVEGAQLARIALGDEVDFPCSLALGPAGLIYVLDRHRADVAVYDKSGSFKYRFLGKGQAQGQLYFPYEIRFDSWGRLCVVEEGNGRMQVFARH